MTTKLTLTIDDSVIVTAKKYAKMKGKSLSCLVENYLKTLGSQQEVGGEISPAILKLKGVIQLPEQYDYKKALTAVLVKKFKR
jgi:hypothetical protein